MPGNICGRKTLRTSCCVMVLAPASVGALAAQVASDDRADDADRIDAGVVVEAAVLDREHRLHHVRGIAESATGRRFSRSPLTSDVSTGASSDQALARFVRRARAARRGRAASAAAVAPRLVARRGPSAAGRRRVTTWPFSSARARHDRDRSVADRELAGFFERGRAARSRARSTDRRAGASVRDWPRRSSSGRANTRGSTRVALAVRAARRSGARSGRSNRWRQNRGRPPGWRSPAPPSGPALAPDRGDANLQHGRVERILDTFGVYRLEQSGSASTRTGFVTFRSRVRIRA